MMRRDLDNWLGEVGKVTIQDWVKGFFSNKYEYGAKSERLKLKDSDFHDVQIIHAAKLAKISPDKLKQEILSQEENFVFSYRAEWREDLLFLVYVPSLKRFICYNRGY